MYDEELAPDIQEAARDKLRENRRKKFSQPAAVWENSSPLPAVSPRSSLDNETETEDVPPESEKDGRIARALRSRQAAKRQAKAEIYKKAGLAGAGPGAAKKYRQVKNLIRVIRGGTLAGTSLGDVVFSLSGLFLSLIGEWAIAKFQLVPGYKMFDPADPFVLLDKALWYGGWAVVAAVALLAAVVIGLMVYLQSHPLEASKFGWELLNI